MTRIVFAAATTSVESLPTETPNPVATILRSYFHSGVYDV